MFSSFVLMGSLEQGLIYAVLALGIFISFRILDIPDLTVDGSFTLGVVASAVLAESGNPILGVVISVFVGLIAGFVTGVLHTKMKIQPILAGILTMTALYSINLRIMNKRPIVSLYQKQTIFNMTGLPKDVCSIIVAGVILVVVSALLYIFLKTQLGMSLRATGDNEYMVRASSIDSDAMTIFGLSLANGFVALSGGVLAQYQNFADVNGGTGMLVIGLASIIIGEAIIGKRSIFINIVAAIIGTIIYRYIIAVALEIGMEAIDLKLFSAIIVTAAIGVSKGGKMLSKLKIKKGA